MKQSFGLGFDSPMFHQFNILNFDFFIYNNNIVKVYDCFSAIGDSKIIAIENLKNELYYIYCKFNMNKKQMSKSDKKDFKFLKKNLIC